MPIYEYECEGCERIFEVIQRFSDPLVETCEICGGTVRRRISTPAIHFKGSGWYVSDYGFKSKAKPESEGSEEGASKKSSESKDSKAGGGSSSAG